MATKCHFPQGNGHISCTTSEEDGVAQLEGIYNDYLVQLMDEHLLQANSQGDSSFLSLLPTKSQQQALHDIQEVGYYISCEGAVEIQRNEQLITSMIAVS